MIVLSKQIVKVYEGETPSELIKMGWKTARINWDDSHSPVPLTRLNPNTPIVLGFTDVLGRDRLETNPKNIHISKYVCFKAMETEKQNVYKIIQEIPEFTQGILIQSGWTIEE